MEKIGVYKEEFDAAINRYAEMRIQYDILLEKWHENGCVITENYTNKAGATNKRKTVLYASMESLRKELLGLENTFGLTPKGLKAIKKNGLDKAKKSKLDEVLSSV